VIGSVNANFFHEELRPLIFRTLQKPKAKYFWISLAVFVVMFLQVLAAYLYVENYFPIPESWRAIIFSLCKNPRKTQLLHHNNLVCAGFPFFIPVVYFWRARKGAGDKSFNGANNQLIFQKRTVVVGILICLLRAGVQLFADYFSTDFLPKLFFGTKDLDIVPDLILKRLLQSFLLATFPVIQLEQMIR
jgi:hypothetical protein